MRRNVAGLAALAVVAAGLAACDAGEAPPPPDPTERRPAAADAADLRRLRHQAGARRTRSRDRRLQPGLRAGRRRDADLAHRGRADQRAQGRRGRPRRLHGLPRRPGLAAGGGADPAGGPAARRARRRLRRRLLARRAPGVQRGRPAPVHAVRHLADGDLLQQGTGRLRQDGGPGDLGPGGAARLDLRPVLGGRRLRDPAAQGHPWGVRRADHRVAGAVHHVRRRPGVRRRHQPHLARVQRRHQPGRAGALARAAPQPHPDPE